MSENTGVSGQQIFDMLMESQFWSAEQMRDYQRSQLAQLLRHAKAHVPFYTTRLDCVLRKDGSIDWDRWEEIPIVTRVDLRDRGAEMLSTFVPKNHGAISTISSSGSTGVPINIQRSELSNLVTVECWSRAYKLHDLSYEKLWAESRPHPQKQSTEIRKMRRLATNQPLHSINRDLPTEKKLELLVQLQPDILSDMPNHIEILARENLRMGKPLKLETVIGVAMGMTDVQRNLFAESFGAESISTYSSKEGGLIAFQCPHVPRHWHVNSEVLYLEVLDGQDKYCALGEEGRSIITPFFNSVQPLIRYDQGDQIILDQKLKCSTILPVLRAIIGRSDAIFKFPGKDVALSSVDSMLIQNSLNADAFQIAQIDHSALEVRYLSKNTASLEHQNLVACHLRDLIQLKIDVNFLRVDQIKANVGGKQHRLVREFEP